mgnify:FL=1|jgi:hypothetical protein|tara:strand:- start:38 stop:394 length:357 start_codon:yes stop_codon:yes gene_type:complete
MSNQKDPKQGFYDLKRDEVEAYFQNANRLIERTDLVLSDHYTGVHVLGSEMVQRVAELHALAGAFESYLSKTFNLEGTPDNAVYRIKMTAATGIVKMVFAIFEGRQFLSKYNISLEDQ